MKKISFIFGTRPEAIKLAPVILAMKKNKAIKTDICVTAQHRQMLDQVLRIFEIKPNVDLDLMKKNQTLAEFTSRAITAIDKYLLKAKPDLVLAQGDTTTVFCTALACFYRRIPFGHVEAGLRTWDINAPWPEEANRVLATRLTTLHFAPTKGARENLLKEGVSKEKIFVTGNTVIDALFLALKKIKREPPSIPGVPEDILKSEIVLITGHRRENFGKGFESICQAIAQLAKKFEDVQFIYPVHLNPNVRNPVQRILGGKDRFTNVHLIKPLEYLPFVTLMAQSILILTDSGGIQEEAPSLGKPVLVMRDVTERPEAITAGIVKLVGTSTVKIVSEVAKLISDIRAYKKISKSINPYGDGKAAGRIVEKCLISTKW